VSSGLDRALADLAEGSRFPPDAPGRAQARERWFAWRAERIAAGLCEFCDAQAGRCGHQHARDAP
jgi:hypothetical protein